MADSKARHPDELRLKPGVSLTQTRFGLANFCLTNLGVAGQHFADALELCGNTQLLQEALNAITTEVRSRCPDRLPALVACVLEANATDADAGAAASPSRPRPAAPSPQRPVPTQAQRDTEAPLRLVAGVSLAQARFVLSEFCLDQFGSRAQPLLEAIEPCNDIAALQKVLNQIGSEVEQRHRHSLPKLRECVREINETGG